MSTLVHGPGAATPPVIDIDLDAEETVEEQLEAQAGKLEEFVAGALTPTSDDELFDGHQFQVKATIDGEDADKIQIGFAGTWLLDPNNPTDVALFEKLKLGRTITLQVEAEVTKKTGSLKRGKDDTETITGHAVLKVVDVYQPTPEELA